VAHGFINPLQLQRLVHVLAAAGLELSIVIVRCRPCTATALCSSASRHAKHQGHSPAPPSETSSTRRSRRTARNPGILTHGMEPTIGAIKSADLNHEIIQQRRPRRKRTGIAAIKNNSAGLAPKRQACALEREMVSSKYTPCPPGIVEPRIQYKT
jgi:hypothetical protein